jgi:hypothetical protein
MRNLFSLLWSCALLACLTPNANAAILSGSVSFDPVSATYTYSYTIDNTTGSAPIWELAILVAPLDSGLPSVPSPSFPSFTSPNGWLFSTVVSGGIANPPYNEVGYFFDWYGGVSGPNKPIPVGSILSGFSFSTYLPPTSSMQNNYFLYGDASQTNLILNGDTGIAEFGRIVAPLAPVPEPSTWAMLLIGFAGIGFAAYRHRSRSKLKC